MNTKEIKKELFLRDARQHISLQEALDYEIHSHWLSFWIWGFSWGQYIMIHYMIRKVTKKYKRYQTARSVSIW